MDPVALSAAVVFFVQGIKALCEKWHKRYKWVPIVQGPWAIVVTLGVCVGEVADKTLAANLPLLKFATLWLLGKVIVGAFGGYSLASKMFAKEEGSAEQEE